MSFDFSSYDHTNLLTSSKLGTLITYLRLNYPGQSTCKIVHLHTNLLVSGKSSSKVRGREKKLRRVGISEEPFSIADLTCDSNNQREKKRKKKDCHKTFPTNCLTVPEQPKNQKKSLGTLHHPILLLSPHSSTASKKKGIRKSRIQEFKNRSFACLRVRVCVCQRNKEINTRYPRFPPSRLPISRQNKPPRRSSHAASKFSAGILQPAESTNSKHFRSAASKRRIYTGGWYDCRRQGFTALGRRPPGRQRTRPASTLQMPPLR